VPGLAVVAVEGLPLSIHKSGETVTQLTIVADGLIVVVGKVDKGIHDWVYGYRWGLFTVTICGGDVTEPQELVVVSDRLSFLGL
jgi:hypothetical protein